MVIKFKSNMESLNQKQKKQILVLAVALVLSYAVYKFITRSKYTNVAFDKSQIPTIGTGATGQAVAWNPEPLAREVYNNLEGWNLKVYPETSKKILALNEAQTIYLYNYYNSYLADEYDTITELFDNEWGGHSGSLGGYYQEVVAKFRSYGLE